MKSGEQIDKFATNVDQRLAAVLKLLPDDLVVSRTSDQPKQVREKINLFMDALYEAIALVVLVSLLGFWERRSALLMALSIPITLAMTFGMMHLLRIDVQQISIASLIIALGLLVDDPIVAADSIKRSLADGASDRGLAGADQTGPGDHVRYRNQYCRLLAAFNAQGHSRRIHTQPSDCH